MQIHSVIYEQIPIYLLHKANRDKKGARVWKWFLRGKKMPRIISTWFFLFRFSFAPVSFQMAFFFAL